MKGRKTMNTFALLKSGDIKRIGVNSFLQKELMDYFARLRVEFLGDKTEVPFDGRYKVEEDEIFFINNYELPSDIVEGVSNPLALDFISKSEDIENIKAIVCGTCDGKVKDLIFQGFDSRKNLSRSFTIISNKDTFTKLTDPGIIIDAKIDAVIKNDKVLFCSYHNTKRVIDLSNYYKEATNEDLDRFADNDLFLFENKNSFLESADSSMRKKIALLQRNKVLDQVDAENIKSQAKELGIDIDFSEGEQQTKIIFPADKKRAKEIIDFLDENYFTAPLTQRKCKTNSKRYLD